MDLNEVVIVATARTALAKSFRGSFNDTEAPVLGGHVVRAVVERAGIEPGEVEDVIMGAAVQQGTQAYNIGRLCAYTGGLPDTVPGMALDRMCASGLMSIGVAAKGIMTGEMNIAIGGGVESLSLTQTKHKNSYRAQSEAVLQVVPSAYIPMLETAEIVSRRYGISRAAQDEYSLQSQLRTAAAQRDGLFDDEIVGLSVDKLCFDAAGQPSGHQRVLVERDECNRPNTRLEDLASLKPVWKDGKWIEQGEFITAGNASQFSDGASASLLMSRAEAKRRGLTPLGMYRGIAVGDQRSLCLPGPALPRCTANPGGTSERQRRRDCHRPPVRHVRRTHGRSRTAGGSPSRRPLCGDRHVHWRRHGCGRFVRTAIGLTGVR